MYGLMCSELEWIYYLLEEFLMKKVFACENVADDSGECGAQLLDYRLIISRNCDMIYRIN